jgi:hypothetical protein
MAHAERVPDFMSDDQRRRTGVPSLRDECVLFVKAHRTDWRQPGNVSVKVEAAHQDPEVVLRQFCIGAPSAKLIQ